MRYEQTLDISAPVEALEMEVRAQVTILVTTVTGCPVISVQDVRVTGWNSLPGPPLHQALPGPPLVKGA